MRSAAALKDARRSLKGRNGSSRTAGAIVEGRGVGGDEIMRRPDVKSVTLRGLMASTGTPTMTYSKLNVVWNCGRAGANVV